MCSWSSKRLLCYLLTLSHFALEEVVLTLVSENSKAYKISIRECRHCGIGFCSNYALMEHGRTCGNTTVQGEEKEPENTVDCTVCEVKFPTHADLIQHNQFHQGTHKFLCRICNRSYQSNPGRLKHEQLEHGSLPLLHCDACGKQFKRKDRLKDHIATKHSLATPHNCPYCDAAFKLRDYLRKHVHQLHPGKSLSTVNIVLSEGEPSQVAAGGSDKEETRHDVQVVESDDKTDIHHDLQVMGAVDDKTEIRIVVSTEPSEE